MSKLISIISKRFENDCSCLSHVDDIDLFTGGVSETPLHGALVGPTFGCLLGMQFSLLRRCDRFWYETSDPLVRFTEDQLTEIRKVQLSKVICTNGDNIERIQKHAMDTPDAFLNPRLPCRSLIDMNLEKWREIQNACPSTDGRRPLVLGRHRRTTPCVSCVCTAEGVSFSMFSNIFINFNNSFFTCSYSLPVVQCASRTVVNC